MDGSYVEAVEYTADGAYAVITRKVDPSGELEVWWRGRAADVVDLVGGQTTTYRLANEANSESSDADLKAWLALPGVAAYTAWSESHPFAPATHGATCGEAGLEISVVDTEGYADDPASGAWEDGRFQYNPGQGAEITVRIGAERRQGRVASWYDSYDQYRFFGEGKGLVTVTSYWSPACDRVVLVDSDPATTFWDGGERWWIAAPGPRIEVVAPQGVPADPVVGALTSSGWLVSRVGVAKKQRPQTVVYAAGGAEDAARTVAGLIPGGATVEPLTWPTEAELLVAVGGP